MAHEVNPDHTQRLTPRENEVLDLLRLGLTNKEIAERLGISVDGAKYHVSEIIAKLGVRSRHEAARWPEPSPWWARVLVPAALLWRGAGAALPVKPSSLALALSGVLLAVVLAGLGLLAFLLARGEDDRGPSVVAEPTEDGFGALPGPEPNAEVVAVSPEIASSDAPVFYVHDADDSNRLIAYDWRGEPRGEIAVSASEPYGAYPSPDGTMLLLTHAHVVSGGTAVGNVTGGTWARNSAHLCVFLNERGGPGAPRYRQDSAGRYLGRATDASLFVETTDGELRRVVDYGSFGAHGGPQVLACNAREDLAVVSEIFVGTHHNLQVLHLSDGHVLYQDTDSGSPGGAVASPDGSLVAQGGAAGLFTDSFIVRSLPSGRIVSRITDSNAVAFSGDNTRVLTLELLNGGLAGRYRVIDLNTSEVVWSAVLSPGTVLAHPHSAAFLVASGSEDVWLVPSDGSPRLLLQHVRLLR